MKAFIILATILLFFSACKPQQGKKQNTLNSDKMNSAYAPSTFGYDLDILNSHHKNILLRSPDGKALVAISPEWQGRVMTSSFNGMEGTSMGWINHNLITGKKLTSQMNPFGGEDRFWLGPEGGQFTIFFKPGDAFEYKNWQVPAEIDTDAFDLVETSDKTARFRKQMNLLNYSGHTLNLLVERDINLLDNKAVNHILGMSAGKLNMVAYESVNKIINTGDKPWTKETGALSIWILGMFQPSETTTVVIPFKKGDNSLLGEKVNDSYFGKIPPERLIVKDDVLYFKGDGQNRGKLGIGPKRALPFMGAYNAQTNILTIVNYTLPDNVTEYVNSMWELQDDPFSGDVVNSYNDGPVEGGGQLGPFYELESSSPAAFLKPGESLTHRHTTIHVTGEKEQLNQICRKIFNVELDDIIEFK